MSNPREEEFEVLKCIYDETELIVKDDYLFEYKVGKHDTLTSFIVQIQWPVEYPNVLPIISLDCFYNGHISSNMKELILKELHDLAKEQLGTASTFTLIEYLKDNSSRYLELLTFQSTNDVTDNSITELKNNIKFKPESSKAPQLSKAQKRRQLDKLGQNGEEIRGSNWVSVIKHLQQTRSDS